MIKGINRSPIDYIIDLEYISYNRFQSAPFSLIEIILANTF